MSEVQNRPVATKFMEHKFWCRSNGEIQANNKYQDDYSESSENSEDINTSEEGDGKERLFAAVNLTDLVVPCPYNNCVLCLCSDDSLVTGLPPQKTVLHCPYTVTFSL
ncbi:Protein Strawberry Notch 2 [Manis pentadactyla]|nr:Protein Strawberry Notch 2 [Manis pentadactyla]